MTDKQHDYGLTETTVDVVTENRKHKVPALTHKNCPGLAVTMFPFGAFGVTHIPTGCRLANVSERASVALLTMSQFALVAEMMQTTWDMLDMKTASSLIADASDRPVPFDGYTSTSQKETRKMTVGEWFQHVRMPVMDEFPREETDPFETAINNLESSALRAGELGE